MAQSWGFLSNEAKYFVLGAFLLFYVGILGGLMIYWTFLFFRKRQSILLRKRLPKVTITICIIFIIDNIIASYSIIAYFDIDSRIDNIDSYIQLIRIFCAMGYRACFLIKFWFIFYDINYIRITVNSQWHSIIDPTINKGNLLHLKEKNKSKPNTKSIEQHQQQHQAPPRSQHSKIRSKRKLKTKKSTSLLKLSIAEEDTMDEQTHDSFDKIFTHDETLPTPETPSSPRAVEPIVLSPTLSTSTGTGDTPSGTPAGKTKQTFLSYAWFISNKKTLGSQRFIIKVVFIAYIIVCAISVSLQLVKLSNCNF